MAEPRDELLARLGIPDGGQRHLVPARLVGRLILQRCKGLRQEAAAVLGHAEEARAAAEQPGGERSLQRVRGAEVGQPGRDRGGGEAVVC
jgi:hypothetical protein